jgi:hypothetical protein
VNILIESVADVAVFAIGLALVGTIVVALCQRWLAK